MLIKKKISVTASLVLKIYLEICLLSHCYKNNQFHDENPPFFNINNCTIFDFLDAYYLQYLDINSLEVHKIIKYILSMNFKYRTIVKIKFQAK